MSCPHCIAAFLLYPRSAAALGFPPPPLSSTKNPLPLSPDTRPWISRECTGESAKSFQCLNRITRTRIANKDHFETEALFPLHRHITKIDRLYMPYCCREEERQRPALPFILWIICAIILKGVYSVFVDVTFRTAFQLQAKTTFPAGHSYAVEDNEAIKNHADPSMASVDFHQAEYQHCPPPGILGDYCRTALHSCCHLRQVPGRPLENHQTRNLHPHRHSLRSCPNLSLQTICPLHPEFDRLQYRRQELWTTHNLKQTC